MKGTVKFFNRQNRFGFITGEDGKEYFVHESGLKSGPITENDGVTFDVEEGDKGPKAGNVSKATSEDSGKAEEPEAKEEPESE